ncbi:MAG: hypothetical protein ACREUT_09375 [Steroidobacteraceae bacterium]
MMVMVQVERPALRIRMTPAAAPVLSAVLSLLMVLASAATGASESSARARIFSNLPDWTGIWVSEGAMAVLAGKPLPQPKLWGQPPYTPGAKKRYASVRLTAPDGKDALEALQQVLPAVKVCKSSGFPAIMEAPVPDYLFELLVTPEQVLLVATDGTVRHIYTDGRPHPRPEELWPTATGDSIGHWEGKTLVIDTIAREAGAITPFPGGANLSDQAHFTERLRRTGADTLEDRLTIEDPQRFTRPWQLTLSYVRVHDVNRLVPVDCEHDRNPEVGGKFIVAPPR